MRSAVLLLLLILAMAPAAASDKHAGRSAAVEHEFQKEHPCPATGQTEGPCPGYVKDHIVALACGGADAVDNMQWQTTAQAKAKDKVERRGCAAAGAQPHDQPPATVAP